MITIKNATISDLPIIKKIAYNTWPHTYEGIITQDQMNYMLDMWYNLNELKACITTKKQFFLLAYENKTPLGFVCYEHNYQDENVTRLHKLYLLPEAQGKGVGKKLINEVKNEAIKNKSQIISLNVNRFNKAVYFYKKMDFKITKEVDLKVGEGYLMEDYVMELKL